jgi:hypothetical protein
MRIQSTPRHTIPRCVLPTLGTGRHEQRTLSLLIIDQQTSTALVNKWIAQYLTPNIADAPMSYLMNTTSRRHFHSPDP